MIVKRCLYVVFCYIVLAGTAFAQGTMTPEQEEMLFGSQVTRRAAPSESQEDEPAASLPGVEPQNSIPRQDELGAYFQKMLGIRQRLASLASRGADDKQIGIVMDRCLAELKAMSAPSAFRQYHDALIKVLETGRKYRVSGEAQSAQGQAAMMGEVNSILDEAGMLGAVQQQMQSMGTALPGGEFESDEGGT